MSNASLAAKLTVYGIFFLAAYLWIAPSVIRFVKSLWIWFYNWYYSEEIETAREFNRLLRLDRLRKRLEMADSVCAEDARQVSQREAEGAEMDLSA